MAVGNVGLPYAAPKEKPAQQARSGRLVQLRIDVTMLLSLIALLTLGLIMVYSASYDYSFKYYGDPIKIFTRQMLWLGLGLAVMSFLTYIDYHFWGRFAVFGMLGTIALLFVVLVMDKPLNGAVRTLFGRSVQPSELAKLVMVLYLSVWLYAKRERLGNIHFGLFPLATILGVLSGLIVAQPDFSAVITILILGGLMFFLAGGDLKQISLLLIVTLLVGFLVVTFTATGSSRIGDYVAGLKDPTEASWQVRRSFEAFARGGWLGVGIGKGEVKLTGLPVPQTDSIYAVVGEELGTAGSLAVVGLYLVLLWRGITISRRAPDQMGSLLAAGLTLWIALEAFINMAVMVNLLPFAGNALPFISSGGSSLVVSMAAMGLIMSVSRLSEKQKEEEGKQFHAVVNLRGRDRRGRVSGAGRSAGAANPVRRQTQPPRR